MHNIRKILNSKPIHYSTSTFIFTVEISKSQSDILKRKLFFSLILWVCLQNDAEETKIK